MTDVEAKEIREMMHGLVDQLFDDTLPKLKMFGVEGWPLFRLNVYVPSEQAHVNLCVGVTEDEDGSSDPFAL